MASKANGKAARERNAYSSLPEVVDSHEMKDIKRNKRIDFRTRAGGGMRSKGRKNVKHHRGQRTMKEEARMQKVEVLECLKPNKAEDTTENVRMMKD